MPKACNVIKKETLAQLCSCEFLRTVFLQNSTGWLLLYLIRLDYDEISRLYFHLLYYFSKTCTQQHLHHCLSLLGQVLSFVFNIYKSPRALHGRSVSYYVSTCDKNMLVSRPEACNVIKKENLAQVFSCEFCKTSKNTFFIEHVYTTTIFPQNTRYVNQEYVCQLNLFCCKKAKIW